MNVLFIGLYPPHIGGIATHTYQLKTHLEALGHHVCVVTYCHDDACDENVEMVHTWPRFRGVSFIKNAYRVAEPLVMSRDIDIIHSHYLSPPGYVGARLSKKHGIPHITTAHGSDVNFMYARYVGRFLIRKTLEHCNAVICVSKALESRVRAITSLPTHYVPNGVDTSLFTPSDEPKEYVLYVGALTAPKRVDDLIDALTGIGEPLVVAGDGPQRPRLVWLARQRRVPTEFVGYTPDVPALMHRAKALVLPSEEEGFGLTLLEAMAAGVPAISRDNGAAREIIEDGKNGLLYSTKEGLAVALRRIISDEGLRSRLIEGGLATARRFTWDCVAARTSDVYDLYAKTI
ncbi:MAG TPA: glycosyltransferase family 4 protein [Methanomicrobia archaeon]|nr:glycosyltransferase family 4 protein [Methanomicrobia archaeon]